MAAPPPPPEPPPGYMFDLSGIGKPFGEILKSYGIYLNGGVYQNFFGFIGGRKTGTEAQGEYTLGADLDLKQMFGIPGAAIHISTDERSGENPSRFTGAGIVSTANYGPTASYRLGELSWDQDLFNDHVRILVGRIADNIDFAGSELYCRFLFSTCGQVNAWYFNNANPSYPVANWGGRVTLKPSLTTYFRIGAYQETSVEGARNHAGWPGESWDFGHNIGVFIPVEIGYKTGFDQSPFPHGFDIGGYYDSSKFTPFNSAPGKTKEGRSAIYFQGQQMIFRPNPSAQRGLTVFGEALLDTSSNGPVAEEFVGGFSWVGPFFGRPADQLNISANYWNFNRNVALASQKLSGFRMARSEWLLELNYAYQLAPGIAIQPVAAYVINPDSGLAAANLLMPNGRPSKNAWILGAQLSIGFNGAFGLPAFTRTN
jgi:porin